MNLKEERISDKHLRAISDFKCMEEENMEIFLKSEAFQSDINNEGNTYLIVDKDNNDEIIAYYSLKCNSMQIDKDGMKRVFPAIEISRLAVHSDYQRKGIGEKILKYIIYKIHRIQKEVAVKYIMIFSVPSAKYFYKNKFKFYEFHKNVKVLPSWETKDTDIDPCIGMYAILD